MKIQLATGPAKWKAKQEEQGIALIITLGILTVILLLGVAFALSARTEGKSAANYDSLVGSKALAKMGIDRCLMELVYNNENTPFSGGNTTIYISSDLTKAVGGNYANDTSPVFAGVPADFVNLDGDLTRGTTEPYWIKVTDRSGKVIGRFAYSIVGDPIAHSNAWRSLVDLNAVGNVCGPQQTYRRTGGYQGITNSITANSYTRGICSDVNLAAFLDKLGYADPTDAALRILSFRYGWPGGNFTPCVGCYNPAKAADDNMDSLNEDPAEYDPVFLRGSVNDFDHALSDLNQLQSLPIAPDSAFSNLVNFATTSSGESNLTNPDGVPRLNLNATSTGNATDVSNVVELLKRTFPNNDTNQLTQWAVNLVDFHTADAWPTVFTGGVGGTNLFIGVKATPYVNQICPKMTLTVFRSGTNAQIQVQADTYVELWNPYSPYSEKVRVAVTNAITFAFNPPITGLATTSGACVVFSGANVPAGYTKDHSTASWNTPWFPTNNLPRSAVVSNTTSWACYNFNAPTQLISVGSVVGPTTNVNFTTTTVAKYTPNVEADDPRLPVLYPQTNNASIGSLGYSIGLSNENTWAEHGGPNWSNREGVASFYVSQASYTNIGEIGFVHRGEQWKTLSVQPGGDGRLLDYIRLNELTEIRGRINLNCEADGLGGAPLQSPSFWALFAGLSNSVYGVVTSNKIENMISGLIAYRDSLGGVLTNISQICEVSNLFYNATWNDIPYTNDAARESIVRDISNLITTRPDSVTEVRAWGQMMKGNRPTGTIAMRAWYTKDSVNKRIKITKFQCIRE